MEDAYNSDTYNKTDAAPQIKGVLKGGNIPLLLKKYKRINDPAPLKV